MRKVILLVLFTFTFLAHADQHWVDANKTYPDPTYHGDGSYENPWNDVAYISWGSEMDIILNFFLGTILVKT